MTLACQHCPDMETSVIALPRRAGSNHLGSRVTDAQEIPALWDRVSYEVTIIPLEEGRAFANRDADDRSR